MAFRVLHGFTNHRNIHQDDECEVVVSFSDELVSLNLENPEVSDGESNLSEEKVSRWGDFVGSTSGVDQR